MNGGRSHLNSPNLKLQTFQRWNSKTIEADEDTNFVV